MPGPPRPSAALVALLCIGGLSACGGSAKPKAASATATTAANPSGCSTVAAPAPKGSQHLRAPSTRLDPRHKWTVTLQTNCGTIAIALDVKNAPRTSSSFASLVKHGFFDGLTFSRVSAGFVIQGGDPEQNGVGGPGYTLVEPPPSSLTYTPGVVAMAKTGAQASGSSGSQFFIVTGPNAATLTPDYALIGRVSAGQAVANRISFIPSNPPGDGQPAQPVVIAKATLTEG